MLESRSLMHHADDESHAGDSERSAPEDLEVAQKYSSGRPRRWLHSKLFQPSTLCWTLLLILGTCIMFYTWDQMVSSQRAILRIPIQQIEFESSPEHTYGQNMTEKIFVKPSDVRIIAIVFYGRRQYVDILDCYLQRNLVRNGGFLEEVHFLSHTKRQEDVDWLEELVDRTPGYRFIRAEGSFGDMWKQHVTESDTLYVKIDDDMTYVHDNAIPRMVQTLISHPESYAVSANVINSPEGHWLHYHTNAILPYLPEPEEGRAPVEEGLISWRPSELPEFPKGRIAEHYNMDAPAPYDNHRWLPLEQSSKNLHRTPIHSAAYKWEGVGSHNWALGAQQHASFLTNLEDTTLNRYFFGDEFGVWNMQNYRYSINFIAIWGSTVQVSEIGVFDEHDIAVKNPERLGRPLLIDSHALVSHFSFGPQQKEMLRTDFLDRYRALANEMICEKSNQKVPFDEPIL